MTRLHRTILSIAVLLYAAAAKAKADDAEPTPEMFEQWAFGSSMAGGPGGAYGRLEQIGNGRVEHYAKLFQLSVAQQEKLRLAAQGDLKRLWDEVLRLRERFLEKGPDFAVGHDRNCLWASRALTFGPGSLLRKTLENMLTDEQLAELRGGERDLLRERRSKTIRDLARMAGPQVPDKLRLEHQLEAVLPPPRTDTQMDIFVALFCLSQFTGDQPNTVLKPDIQVALMYEIEIAKDMEQVFVQKGLADPR